VGAALGGLFFIVLLVLSVFGYRKRRRDLKHLKGLNGLAAAGDKKPPTDGDGPYELNGVSHVKEMSSVMEAQNTGPSDVGKTLGENAQADRLEDG
jgi:hypothetical protein